MAVVAISEYVGVPVDVEANYKGNLQLFAVWMKHLMYGAPFAMSVPPTMTFRELIDQRLALFISGHPDAPNVDWSKVEWEKSRKPWVPAMDKSLAENGLKHKDSLRFTTPGLNGYKGMGI